RLEQLDRPLDGDARAHGVLARPRPLDALLVGRMVREPAFVAHPDLVHLLVAAREQSVQLVAAALRIDVAAVAAACTNRRALVDEPDARLEAEVAVQERADRADVDGVARIGAVER